MSDLNDTIQNMRECSACGGYGKVRHWYAMDEFEIMTCSVCNGSGYIKEKEDKKEGKEDE